MIKQKMRYQVVLFRMLALLAFTLLEFGGAGQAVRAQTPTPTPTPPWTQSGANITNTNTGNVGVGTANPNFKFEIHGASRNTMALFGDGDVVGYAGIKIGTLNSGGIATNRTSAFNLHMRKDSWYGGDGSGPSFIIESTTKGGGFAAPFLITPTNDIILNSGRGAGGPAGYVPPYGNVGIGTHTPTEKLHVPMRVRFGNLLIGESRPGGVEPSGETIESFGHLVLTSTSGYDIKFGHAGAPPRMILNSAGNLGIGAITPAFKLDVAGSVNASGFCLGGDCKTAWSQVGGSSQWTTSGASVYYNAGNVGVGTEQPANRLHVAGGARVDGSGRIYLGAGAPVGARGLEFIEESANTFSIRHHDPNIAWRNIALNPHGGNIGVGTLSPGVKLAVGGGGGNVYSTDLWVENNLHVQGNETLGQGGGRGRLRVGSAWGYAGLYADTSSTGAGNDLVLGAGSGTVRVGPGGGVVQNFSVPNGNLGVGTSSPAFKLDVQGGQVNASGGLCIAGDCKTSWSQVGSSGGAQWTTSGASIFYNSGNVGIGTTGPNQKLEVYNGSLLVNGGEVRLANTLGETQTRLYSYSNADSLWLLQSTSPELYLSDSVDYDRGITLQYTPGTTGTPAGRVVIGQVLKNNANYTHGITSLYTNGTERLRIDSSGNVGIGKSNPQRTLDVEGTINATGAITGGTIEARYQDVAEWVPSKQKLAAGTVVVLDASRTNHVLASTKAYDTGVAGVISEMPGVILGEGGDGKLKVATTGRVKIKVDATRAPISVGDLLVTSDVEGVAMKSIPIDLGSAQLHRPGTIIGKALEPLEKGAGEILVLLSLQ